MVLHVVISGLRPQSTMKGHRKLTTPIMPMTELASGKRADAILPIADMNDRKAEHVTMPTPWVRQEVMGGT